MQNHQIGRILIDAQAIQARVCELGAEISQKFYPEELTLVGILRGALYFLADLSRHITCPVVIDLLSVSSYSGTQSSGTVTIKKDLDNAITNKHVLVVEDIVDTGQTLHALLNSLKTRTPKSLSVCTLLDKPDRRIVPVSIDYCGFTIEDHFVIGYGLDYDQLYRNLPDIAILSKT